MNRNDRKKKAKRKQAALAALARRQREPLAAATLYPLLPAGRLHGETSCACRGCLDEKVWVIGRSGGAFLVVRFSDDEVQLVTDVRLCSGAACDVDHDHAAREMLAEITRAVRHGLLAGVHVITSQNWEAATGIVLPCGPWAEVRPRLITSGRLGNLWEGHP